MRMIAVLEKYFPTEQGKYRLSRYGNFVELVLFPTQSNGSLWVRCPIVDVAVRLVDWVPKKRTCNNSIVVILRETARSSEASLTQNAVNKMFRFLPPPRFMLS